MVTRTPPFAARFSRLFVLHPGRKLRAARLLLAVAAIAFFPGAAAGATFIVGSTLDAVDALPGNGVCATAGGACTLRAAIQEANALAGTHVITLPAGTYLFTIAGRGTSSAATGDLDVVSRNVTINGAGAATTIIDANQVDRVFQVTGGSLMLNDLTVQNGNPLDVSGGCLSASSSQLFLARAIVKGCNAGASMGGGIWVSASTMNVSDTTITQNIATGQQVQGTSGNFSGGGAMSITVNSAVTITRTAISGNSADFGGGIALFGFNGVSTLTVTDSTIAQNVSMNTGGGGLYIHGSGDLVATATIANTTITGNSATVASGGAIAMGSGIQSLALVNVTIAGNSSATLSAVRNTSSHVSVKNTVIANSAGAAPANCFTPLTDLGNNLEFPGTACGFSLPSDRRANPLLGALASNGGPTQTMALLAGSPAIDAGNDAACAAVPVSGVDQRGNARPTGTHCDIGAFEFASSSAPTSTLSDFDGDGTADLTVYRPSAGQWYVLTSSSGFTAYGAYPLGAPGAPGDIPVPGDYDRDGRGDIAMWRPSTGVWTALLSSTGYTGTTTYTWGTASDVPVPGDYDGDGQTDYAVWRPSTGTWHVVRSTGGSMASVWGAGTDRPVPADYDGDKMTDLAVYRPSNGTWYVLTSSSGFTGSTAAIWGVRTDIPVPGDYDGDGRADQAVFRPSNGTWYVSRSTGGSLSAVWGAPTDRVVPGDYDGDKRTDMAAYRPAAGTWYVLTSSSNFAASVGYTFGASTDTALGSVAPYGDPTRRGDLDGDRVTDLGIYRPSTGTWYTLLSRSGFTTFNSFVWGTSEDVPVRGDYDGDGRPDVAVYRPSTGVWFLLTSTSGYATYEAYSWGAAGDVPVPADYDGDGETDVAVYRPSTSTWYVLTSSSHFTAYTAYGWGSPGDVSVPRDYDGDGVADVAVYRPATGTWYVLTSGSHFTTYVSYVVGGAGDVPVPGDYDGDGMADVAVYRPATGAWLVRLSGSNYALASYTWGAGTDVAVPGDYDGDGRTDVAVYRPAAGLWYALLSSTNYTTYTTYAWGVGTDVLVQ